MSGHTQLVAVFLQESGLVLRILDQIAAIVHDLAVMVVGDHIFLAAVFQQAAGPDWTSS